MAKGDDSRARNAIEYQGDLSQNHLNNLRDNVVGQNQNFFNNYLSSMNRAKSDYDSIQGKFKDFSETGGYSADDTANIRSRALAPTRAVYANAGRNVSRQRALQGGLSPGYGALQGRMAREQSQGLSDASTNAEAQIAQMVNEGKRFGTSGMLSAYGATPGMASMAGNQLLGSTGQWIDTQGLQNQLGLGRMNAQISASQIPGKWENNMGRINDVFGIGKKVVGGF